MNTEPKEVTIGRPSLTRSAQTWRVEADVDGTTAWFESSDCELLPRVEAFASAFLGPAQAARRPLRVNAPVDPTWLSNVQSIIPVWKRWWGYDVHEPLRADDVASSEPAPTERTTYSCFSGGADSFHTLLLGPNASRIQRLLFVHGFDIRLADQTRMAAWEPVLRRVAATANRPAVLLLTNLREHPLFRHSNWERTHGGAIASAAHVLGGGGGAAARLIVPSSYTYERGCPWGSSPVTDGLWSSASTEVVHDDASLSRREKVRELANQALAWDALRVCWEGKTATGNCSMCEKCVRTMLSLAACGGLDNFNNVFDRSVPLAQRVIDLKWIPDSLRYTYEAMLKDGLRGEERQAVRRLLAANRPPSLARRAVRKAKRVVRRLLGYGPTMRVTSPAR